MHIEQNYSLKSCNTFGIDTCARYFVRASSTADVQSLIHSDVWQSNVQLVLGGGSNVLLPAHFDGIVLKNEIKGIACTESTDTVYLTVGAGEIWHQLVLYCLEHHYAGIENLSLIPGTVGAAPIQNIGAYGVELKDVFHELTAIHKQTGHIQRFDKTACAFGYRDSVFKQALKNQFIISDVTLKLTKTPTFHLEYQGIQQTLEQMGVTELSLQAISQAVIRLRQSKLPDPSVLPNAGSFFKNPIIDQTHFAELQKSYPSVPHYPSQDSVKVPAGWLIEQLGWKGKRMGAVGVYEKQALVLVNYNHGSADEIRDLAKQIQNDVKAHFNIELQAEVEWI